MLNAVNQNILRFDIPMCDWEHGKIIQTSKYLIGIYFDKETCNLFLFDHLIKVVTEIVHNNVQILRLTFISKEAVCHDQVVGMLQDLQYLMLSIFVFLVLQYLLDCYPLASQTVSTEIHNSKGSLACYSLDLIFWVHITRFCFMSQAKTTLSNLVRLSFENFVML